MTDNAEAAVWPEYMTIPEVAAVLRISKMTVYRMIHRGAFNYTRDGETVYGAIQAGRSFRVSGTALNLYLRESAVTA